MSVPGNSSSRSGASTTIAAARGITKATCSRCKRTVYVAQLVDGTTVHTDPELLAFVATTPGTATTTRREERVLGRRVHAELCETYKLADERKAWAEEQRKKNRPPTVREKRAAEKAANAAKRAAKIAAAQAAQPEGQNT